jgi:hypothetical protein
MNRKNLIKNLHPFVKRYYEIENEYYQRISDLEKEMNTNCGRTDLEFFFCDGFAGIGFTGREHPLIHEYEIIKQ